MPLTDPKQIKFTPSEIDLTKLFSSPIEVSSAIEPGTVFFLHPASIDEVKCGDHVFGWSTKRSVVVKNVENA